MELGKKDSEEKNETVLKTKNMLTASRKEWSELYTVFSLLARGAVDAGNAAGEPVGTPLPIALLTRREHDGERRYYVEGERIRVVGEQMDVCFPREDFGAVASLILSGLSVSREAEIEAAPGVEEFLDAVRIYDMEAVTDDRMDFYLSFYSADAPPVGFRIQSRLCGMTPLLDGGRTANLKWEQTGVRFSGPAVNKINYTEAPDNPAEVARRMLYIESMGGVLKYNDVADKIFRSNLLMIDSNFPRVLAAMLRMLHLDNVARIDELTARVEEQNPLKIKDELVHKHGFYRYKVKQFLVALALGLRPAKMFNGEETAVSGFIAVGAAGELLCYQKADRQTMADYLFTHTRLEKGLPDKDKYGYLERENRAYYLKLNLKVGFIRR